ncbi:MAG: efflux RND transporter permease subunit [Cyanobacteria bacterium]|nr:efflux RND transporter permease subunit [Cyanobacteria bacterium bin.51]
MHDLFFRNRQLLLLTVALVLVWGLSSLFTLPRLEDPITTRRTAQVVTFLPGATPERLEALVSMPLEDELLELEEVDHITSTSSSGTSIVSIELKDTLKDVDPVWSKVRGKIDDATPLLPSEASAPEFRDAAISASALIVGLTWERPDPANQVILARQAELLEERLRALPGTDTVERYGAQQEEITVAVSPASLARLGLTPASLAGQIRASDAKEAAGEIRGANQQLLLELESALDSTEKIRSIPIRIGADGTAARLGDVATVSQGVESPARELAIVAGHPAVVVAATVEPDYRVDDWAQQARATLAEFGDSLPPGLHLRTVLDQSRYVEARLNGVISNLIVGSLLVLAVSLLMLGAKAALIVGAALPLASLMVFGAMKVLGVPLHQMSATGIIIALGLLIDNAILVVDEVQQRLRSGEAPQQAVVGTVRGLQVPMLASTLTTVLAFVPIATSPGASGEFIGSIGLTVILALLSSLFLSLTVIPALVGRLRDWQPLGWHGELWLNGLSSPVLARRYRAFLERITRRPWLGVAAALVLPVAGFAMLGTLEQQFFPPTNRDQFQIELQLPPASAIGRTQKLALEARERIRRYPAVQDVHWFIGSSAPSFFYNVVADRDNDPAYAQGLVQLKGTDQVRPTIRALQQDLDQAFPEAQILVRQLEQGPPFDAPIELRLFGSDLEALQQAGDRIRVELSGIETITHTRASLAEALPKLTLPIDELQALRGGLDNAAVAQQLRANLDGALGGTVLQDTETIPVRVRLGDGERGRIAGTADLDLVAPDGGAVPLSALGTARLEPERAAITRRDGQRLNTVQAFVQAGALPDTALKRLQEQLKQQQWQPPAGVRLELGGEADARGGAVANLLVSVGVLALLMTATLVLSLGSFAAAGLIGSVGLLSVGLAAFALRLSGSLFGFTAILGILGLIGLAINDSIVVLSSLRQDPEARHGDGPAVVRVVLHATRHVITTTLTTIIGFVPLMLDPTGFWPPLAIAIAGGLGGATVLALFYIPAAHLLISRRRSGQLKPQQVSA